jgi:membrane protein DedA with SNARE-associated domain
MALESCCIPLPSEIVMPLAGFFVATSAGTATGRLSLIGVALAGAVGCLLGSAVAYGIGATGGRPLLLRYGKYILISQADSDRADRWFSKYGSPVAFFSRLLPVIRTYISLPAGISRMNFTKFMIYSFLGSLPWSFALAYLGYAFGPALQQKMAALSNVFHGLDVVIILLVLAAIAFYVYRHLKHDRAAVATSANSANSTNATNATNPANSMEFMNSMTPMPPMNSTGSTNPANSYDASKQQTMPYRRP